MSSKASFLTGSSSACLALELLALAVAHGQDRGADAEEEQYEDHPSHADTLRSAGKVARGPTRAPNAAGHRSWSGDSNGEGVTEGAEVPQQGPEAVAAGHHPAGVVADRLDEPTVGGIRSRTASAGACTSTRA